MKKLLFTLHTLLIICCCAHINLADNSELQYILPPILTPIPLFFSILLPIIILSIIPIYLLSSPLIKKIIINFLRLLVFSYATIIYIFLTAPYPLLLLLYPIATCLYFSIKKLKQKFINKFSLTQFEYIAFKFNKLKISANIIYAIIFITLNIIYAIFFILTPIKTNYTIILLKPLTIIYIFLIIAYIFLDISFISQILIQNKTSFNQETKPLTTKQQALLPITYTINLICYLSFILVIIHPLLHYTSKELVTPIVNTFSAPNQIEYKKEEISPQLPTPKKEL